MNSNKNALDCSENFNITFEMLKELSVKMTALNICRHLFIHKGTFNRWLQRGEVPLNYYNDINRLLGNKYKERISYRDRDQFYTKPEISKYCYKKTVEVLKNLDINAKEYTFIEPSAGCCNFYGILPKDRRLGIDIEPQSSFKDEIIKSNYLDFIPKQEGKYIVIGNPPFGLRGNLALRFINHSYGFADAVSFVLPPLFDSSGKGVPMKRVIGYKLAHSEKLPLNSFQYPSGESVDVATIFQVWVKINTDKIKTSFQKTCKTFLRVFSLSDGGTPSSTRNKNIIDKCDIYLPSTCFSGMKGYKSFEELPNKRGYGIVFFKKKKELSEIFFNIDWEKTAFLSTNSALNLRTDLIEKETINRGFYDE